jgi:hypothetical protein
MTRSECMQRADDGAAQVCVRAPGLRAGAAPLAGPRWRCARRPPARRRLCAQRPATTAPRCAPPSPRPARRARLPAPRPARRTCGAAGVCIGASRDASGRCRESATSSRDMQACTQRATHNAALALCSSARTSASSSCSRSEATCASAAARPSRASAKAAASRAAASRAASADDCACDSSAPAALTSLLLLRRTASRCSAACATRDARGQ